MGAKIIQGINDLETKRPDLVKEWHFVLNGDVLPSQVGFSSNKKRWWKCKLGHEWQASPNSRITHAGLCPYCNGKRVWPGFNDLSSQHPDIAAMWHPTKNDDLKPSDVTYGSGKKVWWICSNGHEHQATVNSKLKQKVKCPYCTNQAIAAGFNDLATLNPELASEWHPTRNIGLLDGNGKDISTPNKISSCSSQKVWWLGQCGHEWQSTVHHRTSCSNGCPICAGKQIIVGVNDLLSQSPEIAKEWHPIKNGTLKPTEVTCGNKMNIWWLCDKGHEWQSTVNNRVMKKTGCPVCKNKQLLVGFNDFQTLYPDVATEFHPVKNGDIKPYDILAGGSDMKFWWLGKCGHEWQANIHSRTSNGAGCPICNESHGEKEVRRTLESLHINFKEQFVFADRKYQQRGVLKDDFAVLYNNNVVGTIEYNGEHHYKVVDFSGHNPKKAQEQFNKVLQRDKVKSDYLKAHGIPQLIIPYWQFNEIESIVVEFLKQLNFIENKD